jgi:hypothetical protein
MTKPRRIPHGPARVKRNRTSASVVDLALVRQQHRRLLAERRVRTVLDDNRAALTRLFASGLIFTQTGSRNGRDLLGAHQSLLKAIDQIARLDEAGAGSRRERELDAVFRQLETQLARTTQLTARTGEFLSGRGRE